MTNSSRPPPKAGPTAFRNVPAPQGSRAAAGYNRFIPREELQDFASWTPGSLSGGADAASAAAAGRFSAGGAFATAPVADTKPAPPATPAAPPPPTAQEWQARVSAARQAGYQDGYRDGLVALEGFKQSFAQQATQQIGALLQAFDEQQNALDEQIAAAVAATAVALARQVLKCELQTRPELVAEVAAQAVHAVMHSARHISVLVHPLDLPLVAEGAEEALATRGARLQADPRLVRGGVRVVSDVGAVDARIASRWQQAAAALGSTLPWSDEAEAAASDA